jgi:hypothetical protein
MPQQVNNIGRQINFISGITGVSPGGVSTIQMPTNLRAHRLDFNCSGIAYQSPTATKEAADTGTGTFTLTVTNGVITAIAIATSNSSLGAGTYPLTILDSLYTAANGLVYRVGQGATGTYTVNGSNVITAAAITLGGVVAPIPPELFFTSFKQLVNGVNIRDIQPAEIMRIQAANPQFAPWLYSTATAANQGGPYLSGTGATASGLQVGGALSGALAGNLPVFFTEPWRNLNHHNEVTSWDLFGQGTWQIQAGVASNITSPSLVGAYEFDNRRNTRPSTKGGTTTNVPFLQPVAQHQFAYPVPTGRFDLTTLPAAYPISRIWLYETNSTTGARLGAGSIYQLEIYQDGNKILEVTADEMNEMYNEYGFNTAIYDAAYIADPDQRLWKALKIASATGLLVRVYSTTSAVLNVIMETLPGAYA